jgi:hypothetical protein
VVLIVRGASRASSDVPSVVLPFPVEWRQWRTAVVPVLEDETWRVDNPLWRDGERSEYLRLLGRALRASFESAGWGPRRA